MFCELFRLLNLKSAIIKFPIQFNQNTIFQIIIEHFSIYKLPFFVNRFPFKPNTKLLSNTFCCLFIRHTDIHLVQTELTKKLKGSF